MRSLMPESAEDPSFQELSPAVQETLRAMWRMRTDRSARAEWQRLVDELTEEQSDELSAWAHRMDYPEQYED